MLIVQTNSLSILQITGSFSRVLTRITKSIVPPPLIIVFNNLQKYIKYGIQLFLTFCFSLCQLQSIYVFRIFQRSHHTFGRYQLI